MPSESAPDDDLPDYAEDLHLFHLSFEKELTALVERVPLRPTDRVVDVGCGDGFYVTRFAQRLRSLGSVVGLDVNEAFLELARRRTASPGSAEMRWIQADLNKAAAAVGEPCDVVWCAQSLYTFSEPESALRSMARLVRPGGIVAVLENDTLHQLLMPWSSRMEMAIRVAEREAFERESPHPGKYYVGRRLPATLAAAGLEPLGYFTQSIDRTAPLGENLERFLQSYLMKLLAYTGAYLSNEMRDELRDLLRPDGERYLLRQPHFTMTWLNFLAWARRPT